MAGRFTVEAVFKAVDKMSAPIVAMSKKIDGMVKASEKGLGKVNAFNDKVSAGIKRASAVATGAALATAAIVRDIVQTGAEFDKALVGAAAKFDPAIKRGTLGFEQLRQAAEDIGEKTEFNALQGAQALKALAASGFNSAAAIAVLPGVVDLATASEIDLNAAAEMATKSLGAFGLKTDDTAKLTENLARVNNVMAKTAGATEASMEGLFESIKEGGPISVAAGQQMETFMAMAGKLAAAGIEGSVAGTTLKNVFTSFSTKKGTTALKAIGVTTQKANGEMLDAVDILKQLETKTAGMGSAKRLRTLEGIFGKIPLAGISKLLEVGADKIGEFRDELNGAVKDNAMGKLAGAMRDTVAGDIDELTSSIDGVKIALFSTNNAEIRKGLTAMTEWVRKMKPQIIEAAGKAVKWLGTHLHDIWKWMVRIGKAVAYFYAFSTAVKAVQTAIAAYESAVALASAANFVFRKSVIGWSKLPGWIASAAESAGFFNRETYAAGKGLAGWRDALNDGLLSKRINGINSLLGKAGMLGLALGIGVAIGSWLNEAFGLDKKLEEFIEEITGLKEKLAGRDQKPDGRKRLGDGSIQNADGSFAYKSPVRAAREVADAAKRAADAMRMPNLMPIDSIASKYGVDTGGPDVTPFFKIPAPQVVTPQARAADEFSESNTTTTEKAELTIKDETGRAELTTKPSPSPRSIIIMQRAGAF